MSPELKEVMQDVLEVDAISEDASAETIENWDSVRHLNLVLAIEERFGVSFEAEEIPELTSARAIAEALKRRG